MFLQQADHALLCHHVRRGMSSNLSDGLCHMTCDFRYLSCELCLQVKELAAVSLKQPVRIFVNSNTDVAPFLRQEFVRIRPHREGDREAVVAGNTEILFLHHIH